MTPDRRTAPPPGVDVLLVEDDAVTSTLVVDALHGRNLTTDVAGDVFEAKRLLSRGEYTDVVVDLLLADGSGSEVIERLEEQRLHDAASVNHARAESRDTTQHGASANPSRRNCSRSAASSD